jgi:hypothetical protein
MPDRYVNQRSIWQERIPVQKRNTLGVNINAAAESLQVTGSIRHTEEFVTVMSPTPPFLNTKTAKNAKRKLI